jgi:tRNA-2-methylthio-N6-dimethylallyladenosine synthase
MPHYYIWTEGCQMNVADSRRLAGALEALGYSSISTAEDADVIVLNTCVVRQSAEDKAYGRLTTLRPLKARRPELVINLMGCLVGRGNNEALRKRFPYVDVFSPPSDPRPLVDFLVRARASNTAHEILSVLEALPSAGPAAEAGLLPFLPLQERAATAFVPIVLGCSHACAFCIIPYRRGGEQSRPAEDIVRDVQSLAASGVREVTLLGQIVDRYGMDRPGPDLPMLLRQVHNQEGVVRIRFLTSHPVWMTDSLLQTVQDLPKVCEHIEVPVQAGDNEVLARMHRGYTVEEYRRLIDRIRTLLPNASIGTDIIVGFPGETSDQFQRTYDLLAELRLDVAHLARYSPRPGTLAARTFTDDVPLAEKMSRFRALETLQENIALEKNLALVGTAQEILVEGRIKGRWMGRTRSTRLVFFDDDAVDRSGTLVPIKIERASAWSLQGTVSG